MPPLTLIIPSLLFAATLPSKPPSLSLSLNFPPTPQIAAHLDEVGTFQVHYTVSAAWLQESVAMTREVIVQDVNECTYDGELSWLHHSCGESMSCVNTVGSYTCE